jgi:putative ABC transport system permease protein
MSDPIDVGLLDVAGALVLVAVAVGVTLWQRVELEREIGWAALRAFVQLTAVGYVIQLVFRQDTLALVVALLAGMAIFGAHTARRRAPGVPHGFWPLLAALGLAGAVTLGLVVAVGVFEPTPRYLVPLGGMVIGNAMTAAAVALNRLADEVGGARNEIEAVLALGATSTQAVRPLVRRSLRSGLIPLVDSTKTTGVIFFPGTMVGMLLAGAEPLEAVRLQLVILYTLLGSVAVSALVAVLLVQRQFFTAAHQLRDLSAPPGDAVAEPGGLGRPAWHRRLSRRTRT